MLCLFSPNVKKKKGITLKASSSIQEESDKEDLNEIEEMMILVSS